MTIEGVATWECLQFKVHQQCQRQFSFFLNVKTHGVDYSLIKHAILKLDYLDQHDEGLKV